MLRNSAKIRFTSLCGTKAKDTSGVTNLAKPVLKLLCCLQGEVLYLFRATALLIALLCLSTWPHVPMVNAIDPPTDNAADNAKDAAPAVEGSTVAVEDEKREAKYRNELLHGRVVWLAAALRSRFGITSVPEVAENGLAILTTDGSLVPIVENLRGRAFRKDPRLLEMELELLVRRYEHQPFVQVVKIFEVEGDKRNEIDYWCDVCAIIMYEYGPCSCCQDQNRLRRQLVTPTTKPAQ